MELAGLAGAVAKFSDVFLENRAAVALLRLRFLTYVKNGAYLGVLGQPLMVPPYTAKFPQIRRRSTFSEAPERLSRSKGCQFTVSGSGFPPMVVGARR